MICVAIFMNLSAAFGLALLSMVYLFGPAPASYHAKILHAWHVKLEPRHQIAFKAINLVLGSFLLALSLCMFVVTFFGISEDLLWAKILIFSMGLITGIPATYIAFKVEQTTTVKTPWRFALALTLSVFVSFLLSIY